MGPLPLQSMTTGVEGRGEGHSLKLVCMVIMQVNRAEYKIRSRGWVSYLGGPQDNTVYTQSRRGQQNLLQNLHRTFMVATLPQFRSKPSQPSNFPGRTAASPNTGSASTLKISISPAYAT